MPIIKGVGAKRSCSEQLIQVGRSGMIGNMYSSGYIMATKASTDMDNALLSRDCNTNWNERWLSYNMHNKS